MSPPLASETSILVVHPRAGFGRCQWRDRFAFLNRRPQRLPTTSGLHLLKRNAQVQAVGDPVPDGLWSSSYSVTGVSERHVAAWPRVDFVADKPPGTPDDASHIAVSRASIVRVADHTPCGSPLASQDRHWIQGGRCRQTHNNAEFSTNGVIAFKHRSAQASTARPKPSCRGLTSPEEESGRKSSYNADNSRRALAEQISGSALYLLINATRADA